MGKLAYYGYKISPNQLETDEGFLICRNVPIARTGDQQYLASELGLDGDKVVTVHRPEEEVFSEATIASFEGKPITDNHPSELLDSSNVTIHSKGHAQNIRRGAGEWSDYLVGDLFVQDERLIEEVRNGKREVSCGYAVDYVDNGDGTYTQRNIRGNHIAIVEEGRAGHKAAIMDSINKAKADEQPERNKKAMSKNAFWSTLFGHAAEGKSAEEITKMVQDTADALNESEGEKTEENTSDKCGTKDEDYSKKLFESIDALNKRLDMIEARLPKNDTEDVDPIETALKEMEKIAEKREGEEFEEKEDGVDKNSTDVDAEEAVTVPAENMDACKDSMDAATIKAILTAVKPSIAGIKNADERKAVTDALLGSLKIKNSANDSVKLAQALPTMKPANANKGMSLDEVQKAYDQLNPHTRKENK
jgi:hypothetical protein